jgi:hypothetical protein
VDNLKAKASTVQGTTDLINGMTFLVSMEDEGGGGQGVMISVAGELEEHACGLNSGPALLISGNHQHRLGTWG